MSQKNEPFKTYKHKSSKKDRSCEAAVWKNETDDGRTFFNVTFKAQYKDGDSWETTTSYGLADLFRLSRCITDAIAAVTFASLRQGREEDKKAA